VLDQDGDGEADTTDRCPATPPGSAVDQAGCSIEEYCALFDAKTKRGRKNCLAANWRNDEPDMKKRSRDCEVDKGAKGRADDRCVPSGR
jgi:hypothetical protein